MCHDFAQLSLHYAKLSSSLVKAQNNGIDNNMQVETLLLGTEPIDESNF